MSDLGERLRRARESRGLSLQDVAAATKISVVALEALERLDFGRVPGGIFGRAFARSYAAAVGLDAEATAAEFQEARARHDREAETEVLRPQVTADDRAFLDRQQRAIRTLRWGLVVAVVIGLAVLAYEVWLWWPRPEPATVGTSPPDAAQVSPAFSIAASQSSGKQDAGVASLVMPPPAPTAGLSEAPPPTTAMVFEFAAVASCWLHLTSDGAVLLNRELQAGDRHRVEALRELRIHAGSAGALTWTINGQPAASLGESGRTARVVVTRGELSKFLLKR